MDVYYQNNLVISFNALDAFKQVSPTASTKVPMSAKWDARRDKEMIKDVAKDYDWTYTTLYKGTSDGFRIDQKEINMDLLTRHDPILYYSSIILYEDELGDFGTGILTLKVRVMPTSFLILQRYFLRVDNVLVKLVDTRIFHEFGSKVVIREFKIREMQYSDLVNRIPTNMAGERDLSIVNNDGWVSSVMTEENVTDFCLESYTLSK